MGTSECIHAISSWNRIKKTSCEIIPIDYALQVIFCAAPENRRGLEGFISNIEKDKEK